MKSSIGKVKAYGLIRDVNGKPKIDNTKDIPLPIWEMLTEQEKQEVIKNGGNASSSNP